MGETGIMERGRGGGDRNHGEREGLGRQESWREGGVRETGIMERVRGGGDRNHGEREGYGRYRNHGEREGWGRQE